MERNKLLAWSGWIVAAVSALLWWSSNTVRVEDGAVTLVPPPGVVEPDRVVRDESVPELERFSQALARGIHAARKAATGVIRGSIIDPEGRPVEGVLVQAYAPFPDGGVAHGSWDNVGVVVNRSGMSDTEGLFVIEGLLRVPHDLKLEKEGYSIVAATGERGLVPDTYVEFVAVPTATVLIDVLMPDGSQAAKARVTVWGNDSPHGGMRFDWNPDSPSVEVRGQAGPFRVSATTGERFGLKADPVDIVLKEGGDPPEAVLQLREVAWIRGNVVFASGDRPERVHVFALAEGERDAPPSAADFHSEGLSCVAFANGRYSFRWSDVPNEVYWIGVTGVDGRVLLASERVEANSAGAEYEIIVPRLAEERHCEVVVLGPSGDEEFGAAIAIWSLHDGHWTPHGLMHTVTAAGRRKFFWPTASTTVESVDWRIRVNTANGNRWLRAQGAERRLTARYQEPGSLRVIVAGHESSPLRGKLSVFLTSGSVPRELRAARTERRRLTSLSPRTESTYVEPYLRFDPVQPGAHVVSLLRDVDSRAPGMVPIQEAEVYVGSGREVEYVFEMPVLGEVFVMVNGQEVGSVIEIERKDFISGGAQRAVVDETNVARFSNVPSGIYTAYVNGVSQGEDFEFSGQGTFSITPRTYSAATVEITNPRGALAKSGVRSGDVVRAPRGGSLLQLLVERNGVSQVVAVPPRALGARFDPIDSDSR